MICRIMRKIREMIYSCTVAGSGKSRSKSQTVAKETWLEPGPEDKTPNQCKREGGGENSPSTGENISDRGAAGGSRSGEPPRPPAVEHVSVWSPSRLNGQGPRDRGAAGGSRSGEPPRPPAVEHVFMPLDHSDSTLVAVGSRTTKHLRQSKARARGRKSQIARPTAVRGTYR